MTKAVGFYFLRHGLEQRNLPHLAIVQPKLVCRAVQGEQGVMPSGSNFSHLRAGRGGVGGGGGLVAALRMWRKHASGTSRVTRVFVAAIAVVGLIAATLLTAAFATGFYQLSDWSSKIGSSNSVSGAVASGNRATLPPYRSLGKFVASRFRPRSKNLSLPAPYGHGAPVIENVLSNVTEFIAGGLDVDWNTLAKTADENHLHGKDLGLNPVTRQQLWVPTPFDFSTETMAMKRVAHTKSCFNKRRSDSLSLRRPIPDVRPVKCSRHWYYRPELLPGRRTSSSFSSFLRPVRKQSPDSAADTVKYDAPSSAMSPDAVLPDTSVVFVMVNEPLSPLLRSIYSVLDRTPPELLREIIIVDDGSSAEEAPWLAPGGEFERHIGFLPKIKLCRLSGRNGLMRARNVGIALSTGDTVTVLDSHIEVNVGWLQPLMGRIAEGRAEGIHRVVVPVIDSIEADDFTYTAGGIDILGHSWTLGQVGVYRPQGALNANPMSSPIMAGGLFSVDRQWFNDLGYYDPSMRLWGGEESEISFRIWQCGGSLECLPCSRVGHIFRSSKYWQGQVYKVPGHEVTRNKLRTAMIWMDQYAELVKLASAPLPSGVEVGSLEYMQGVRDRLHCKPYSWYLSNVYPEILPSADRLLGSLGSGSLRANGYLRSPGLNACIDTLNRKNAGEAIGAYPCHYLHGTQALVAATDGTIVVAELAFSSCLTRAKDFASSNGSSVVTMQKCEDSNLLQKWVSYNDENKPAWIYEKESEGGDGLPRGCLTVVQETEPDNKSSFTLRTTACQTDNPNQLWEWESIGRVSLSTEAIRAANDEASRE